MSSHLTRDEVAHIADLARLELSASEQELFARQLTDILAYAAIVQQVDTSTVETDSQVSRVPQNLGTSASAKATADKSEPRNPGTHWRPDQPVAGVSRDDALAEAPDGVRDAGLFRVPKVI